MSQKHAIRLPGLLLDELKTKSYDSDERFQGKRDYGVGKKRGSSKQVSRKDRRKQQRLDKRSSQRSKAGHNEEKERPINVNNKAKTGNFAVNEKNSESKKARTTETSNSELLLPPDDELSSDDFEEFEEDDLDEEGWRQLREMEEEDGNEDVEPSDHSGSEVDSSLSKENTEKALNSKGNKDMTIEETMEALKALKEKKNEPQTQLLTEKNKQKRDYLVKIGEQDMLESNMTAEETMAALKSKKEKKNEVRTSKSPQSKKQERKSNQDKEISFPIAPGDRAAMERDEMDMQYYAKKLGLKRNSKKLHARDEYDAIGGLLEGLDFIDNYGIEDEEYGEYGTEQKSDSRDQLKGSGYSNESADEGADEGADESEYPEDGESELDSEELKLLPSDDDLSSDDFDEFAEDDLNEEEWEQLREMEESGDHQDGVKRKRENPLVAPVEGDSGSYVPPWQRKKALETGSLSAAELEVQKKVKSSLNKLSDTNISVIISSLNELYESYARQYVTDAISKQILEIIGQTNKLLDSFIMNYAAVAFALWKLRGVEVGASYIQVTIEHFLKSFDDGIITLKLNDGASANSPPIISKESSNILCLLSYSYNFGIVSSNLIYDIVHLLVASPNEFTTELLLRVISISGPLIRSDDASALKEIISKLLHNVKEIKIQSPRLKFLLDTVTDLKNNRLKPSLLAASYHPLKKTLQNVLQLSATSSEPLLVSLEDIKNVENKGKWWLVGASWKGNMEIPSEEMESRKISKTAKKRVIEDDLLDDLPDWSEIARQQRMNTDVRRAIFISIMSAQDYMDAFGKLEKLNLKKKQGLEIPRVLLHCLSQDSGANGYNPYYALLALKLCENQHSLVKSFQFLFWDIIKAFEDEEEQTIFDGDDVNMNENMKLRNIANRGKFFGYLIAEGILQLDAFKHVSLVSGLVADGVIFVEFLLYQLLLTVAKKSESKGKDSKGKKVVHYNSGLLIKILINGIKLENRSVILKGLLYFTKKNFKYKKYLPRSGGTKALDKELRRMEWATNTFSELMEKNLENAIV